MEKEAIKLATNGVREYMDGLKEYSKVPFGTQEPSEATRRYKRISQSPKAMQLLVEGYPATFADRVARLEIEGEG